MRNEQMELGFNGNLACRRAGINDRQNRAAWWFRQMRLAVDSTLDWHPPTAVGTRPRLLIQARRATR